MICKRLQVCDVQELSDGIPKRLSWCSRLPCPFAAWVYMVIRYHGHYTGIMTISMCVYESRTSSAAWIYTNYQLSRPVYRSHEFLQPVYTSHERPQLHMCICVTNHHGLYIGVTNCLNLHIWVTSYFDLYIQPVVTHIYIYNGSRLLVELPVMFPAACACMCVGLYIWVTNYFDL